MSIGRVAAVVLVAGALPFVACSAASARIWKPSPAALDQDYATILDTRGAGELVELIWLVPEMVRPETTGAEAAKAILQEHVVLMAIHGQLDKKTASFSFEDVGAPDVKDQGGKQLIAVPRDELSPKTAGTLAVMETMFRQSFGAMGKSMKVFIFKPDGVSSCGKGGISVGFAGETYTWETPIPGCSSQ